MSKTCPKCGTKSYGTPFCVFCQEPLGSQVHVSGKREIDDPQPVDIRPAGAGRRILAFLLDWIILSITVDFIYLFYRFGSGHGDRLMSLDKGMGISSALFLIYFTMLTGDNGQTLGKRVLGIRVIRVSGEALSYMRAFGRTLCYVVSSMLFGLGFIWAIFDSKKQGWHDKIAGTRVVRV